MRAATDSSNTHLEFHKYDPWVLKMILENLSIVDMVHFTATCKWMHKRFSNDPRFALWRERWRLARCNHCISLGTSHVCTCDNKTSRVADLSLIEAATIGDISLTRLFIPYAESCGWAVYKASRHDHAEVLTCLLASEKSLYTVVLDSHQMVADYLVDLGTIVRGGKLSKTINGFHPHFLLHSAAYYGDLEAFSAANLPFTCPIYYKVFQIAGKQGHLHILRTGDGHFTMYDGLYRAIKCNHTHIISWWFSTGKYVLNRRAYNLAAIGGAIDAMNVLFEHDRYRLDVREAFIVCVSAIVHNRIEVLEWMWAREMALPRLCRLKRIARRHNRGKIADFIVKLQKSI